MNQKLTNIIGSFEGVSMKTPKFNLIGNRYVAKCVSVYDGDTANFVVCLNDEMTRFACRMTGYNSAEMKTKDELEKQAGIRAKKYLSSLILGKICVIEAGKFEKYGRLLTTVYVLDESDYSDITEVGEYIHHVVEHGINVNVCMVDKEYGQPYVGIGAKAW
jgi:endonuclease YncB( thermonuclease family)